MFGRIFDCNVSKLSTLPANYEEDTAEIMKDDESPTTQQLRRSERIRRPPDFYYG